MGLSVDIALQHIGPVTPLAPPGSAASAPPVISQKTSEQAGADEIGASVTGGVQDGLTAAYDPVNREVNFTNTDKGTVAVTAHEAAVDPHPQYHTAAEVDADIAAHSVAADPHGDRAFAVAEIADAVNAHELDADPHPGYLLADGSRAINAATAATASTTYSLTGTPYGYIGNASPLLTAGVDTDLAVRAEGKLSLGIGVNERVFLDDVAGLRYTHKGPNLGLGYATGAGAAVTQLTDKSTGVTVDGSCGAVSMSNDALADNTTVAFTVSNSSVQEHDVVVVNHQSGGDPANYLVWAGGQTAGAFNIYVRNITAGPLSDALVINFVIIKGTTS